MKQVVSALFILCILSFGTYHIVSASHEVQAANVRQELSFKSISVTGKDTLWSIAKENYSKEYGSLNDYIKEIKRCNSLTSDRINAGSSIIVPIYVSSEQS
jgi:hypothetical protein